MPWTVDYSAFGNMGISSWVCSMGIELIQGWKGSCRNRTGPRNQQTSRRTNGESIVAGFTRHRKWRDFEIRHRHETPRIQCPLRVLCEKRTAPAGGSVPCFDNGQQKGVDKSCKTFDNVFTSRYYRATFPKQDGGTVESTQTKRARILLLWLLIIVPVGLFGQSTAQISGSVS